MRVWQERDDAVPVVPRADLFPPKLHEVQSYFYYNLDGLGNDVVCSGFKFQKK